MVLALILVAVAVGCGDGDNGNALDAGVDTADGAIPTCPGGMVPMELRLVAGGFSQPVFVTSPPGDNTRLFVVEREGRIRIVKDGAILPHAFLDLAARVYLPSPASEAGLLGLAFHPDYDQTGRFWVFHSAASPTRVTVVEYARSASDHDRAEPNPVRELLATSHNTWNHLGGMLAFGPDGYLYVGIGDSATSPSPARDLSSRRGKILRLDVDTHPTAPPGNLAGGDPYIWDYGLRNPWRFSFDRGTGALYIGDVGQDAWEEINVEPAGSGGRDYGWDVMEASHCYPSDPCTSTGVLPVVEKSHDDAWSIIGGYVYRGTNVPCLRGRYVYADYGSARFWSLVWDGSAATEHLEHTADLNPGLGLTDIVSFGEGPSGELHVVSITAGAVYRIQLED